MINYARLVASLFSVAALAFVPRASVGAQTPPADAVQACVCLDGDRDEIRRLRMVSAGEPCRHNERRMLVVASKTTPFVAEASAPAPPADVNPAVVNSVFVSRLLTTLAPAPASAPLLIEATLLVDTDRAMFTIPPPSAVDAVVDGRGQPSSVSCVPLVDGRPAGMPTRLSPRSRPVGLFPGVGLVDPLTGRVDQPSPGYFPDILWSRLDTFGHVSAGLHELAVACQGPTAFRFRGVGNLVVLQQAPRG